MWLIIWCLWLRHCNCNLHAFNAVCRFFSKSTFLNNSFRITISVSNSLGPDQVLFVARPDLSPNCLQKLSAENTSWAKRYFCISRLWTTCLCAVCILDDWKKLSRHWKPWSTETQTRTYTREFCLTCVHYMNLNLLGLYTRNKLYLI